MLRRMSRSSITLPRFSAFVILLLVGYILTTHRSRPRPPRLDAIPQSTNSEGCLDFPTGARVVVSVKTGATEAAEKIPSLMQTSLRCAKHVLLFSDLEQDIESYHIHDALNSVAASIISNNPDFKFYRKLKALWQEKGDISALKRAKSAEDSSKSAAWTLDKYKFLHVMEKSWEMKPDMDWYILIDADSYIFWSNMLVWLQTMDPSKKSYFGSEVNIGGHRFAHGGSGIVMSGAAVKELVVNNRGVAEKWDGMIREREMCCGDEVLGVAFIEMEIELKDAWPMMSGESPWSLPVGRGTPEYGCRPMLTMHHLSPGDMRELSGFEKLRPGSSEPLTYPKLFIDYLMPQIGSRRQNWDNLASDPGEFGKTGGVSVNAATFFECTQACETDSNCFQYAHHGSTCHIGMSVRLGHAREADEDGMWESGWNLTRLREWMAVQPSCDQITFPVQHQGVQEYVAHP